jgi:hypothetical protein
MQTVVKREDGTKTQCSVVGCRISNHAMFTVKGAPVCFEHHRIADQLMVTTHNNCPTCGHATLKTLSIRGG